MKETKTTNKYYSKLQYTNESLEETKNRLENKRNRLTLLKKGIKYRYEK